MLKCITVRTHTRPLTCVHFNRDGDILFSTAKDGMCVATAPDTGKRIGYYKTPPQALTHCDTTYDSSELAVASADQKVYIFDVITGAEIEQINVTGPCKYVEYNRQPNGQNKLLAVVDRFATADAHIMIWKKEDGKYVKHDVIELARELPKCLEAHWGPYDETIITGHEKGRLMVWNREDHRVPVLEKTAHADDIKCMAFSEDRLLLLTCAGAFDKSAKLWDSVELELMKTYPSDRPLNACDISPLWNHKDKERRAHILIGGGQEARDVAESGQEGRFQALLHHLIYGDEIGQVKGHFSPINALKFMPDGTGFASGAEEGNIKLWKFDQEVWNKLED